MDAAMKSDENAEKKEMAGHTYHITPGDDGWLVKAGGEPHSTIYPNKMAAISAARQMMNRAGVGQVIVHRRDGRIETEEGRNRDSNDRRRLRPDLHAPSFSFPGESERPVLQWGDLEGHIVQEFAAKTGEGPDEIIRKALALYKAAIEAVEQGKAVGIASDPSHLESEFVGF